MLDFIGRLTARQRDPRLLLGPGDDCALIRAAPGRAIVLTTDEMAEGTHFLLPRSTPEQIGRKLARINLSDMAGMGNAVPVAALCGAGLPESTPWQWVKEFTEALMSELNSINVSLAGGNLTRSDKIHVYLTVTGEAKPSETARRGGARPGDIIFGIGAFGEARAGLEILLSGKPAETRFKKLLDSFWLPPIQLEAGAVIGKRKLAAALMDNSDGLYKSVKTIAAASGCGALIEVNEDARSPALAAYCAARKKNWRDYVVSGGEDYGLVLAVNPRKARGFIETFPQACCLGVMTAGRDILFHENCKPRNFEHF
ncbi:MAG: thiamine-phosphate kinase [Elusimicrobiales bacterium]|nr:thiamine-phosphate kinase [Elusimicrobiales bacterium]